MSGGMKITGGGHPEAGGIVRIIQEHPVESAITGLSLGVLACGVQGLTTPAAPTEVVTYSPTPFVGTPTQEKATQTPKVTFDASIQTTMANDAEYGEMTKSLENGGQVKGTDYGTGENYQATVDLKTVSAETTSDWYYKVVVKAEATDNVSKEKYNVIWNPDTNTWVKITKIELNPAAYENITLIHDIDGAIKSGDLDLILIGQGNGNEAFPAQVKVPQAWVNIDKTVNQPGTNTLFISNFPQNTSTNTGWEDGRFKLDDKPWRKKALIRGLADNNDETVVAVRTTLTSLGNVYEKFGFDAVLHTPKGDFWNEVVQGGPAYIEQLLFDDYESVALAPLPGDIAPWNPDDPYFGMNVLQWTPTVANMQVPGELFNLLPLDVQEEVRNSGLSTQKSFKLEGGMTAEMARYYSRTLGLLGLTSYKNNTLP